MKKRSIQITVLPFLFLWTFSVSALSLFGDKEEEPLLKAADAFLTRVILDDQNRLNVEIDIAEGYFVYRSKINVSSANVQFAALEIPDGVKKQDQFFGEVETYRGLLKYIAPLAAADKSGEVKVNVQSQGCADVGICYPPYSKEFTVNIDENTLAALNSSATSVSDAPSGRTNPVTINTEQFDTSKISASSSLINSSRTSLSAMLSVDTDDEVLDPDVAFTLDPVSYRDGALQLKWNIHEGHYLYKKKFLFELMPASSASLGDANMSKGVWEEDAFFGKSEVYRNSASIQLPIAQPEDASLGIVKITYQGCADIGICYPPQHKEIQLAGVLGASASSSISNAGATTVASNTVNQSAAMIQTEQDRLADSLKGNNRWLTIATFFGMGLLLTFTPCVLPMVPILSSIIVGSGDKIGTGRAFTLSLVYVLAMALTYTVAGVLVGLSGENIQATLQHPAVLTAFAFLFVLLSLSMFGFYEIQMPAFIQDRLSSVSNRQKGGSIAGVATMGFLSAIIVGPCVTAPLVGALIYIGQTGDAVLGGAALFALSMGMGLPLLIIGTTFGKYLPRAGAWMDITKAIFGVMLLGLAIYMLDRVIPDWATMLLSALLLICVGMFMGAFDSMPAGTPAWKRLSKGFGYTAIAYGTLLMIGVTTGKGTLLRPMQGMTMAGAPGSESKTAHAEFQRIKSTEQLKIALADAKANGKPVLLDFYADWCISCKEMEAFTFTDSQVASRMDKAILLQADVTANDKLDKELLREFGIFGPPAIILYDASGTEHKNARVVGFMKAEEFSSVLDRVF